ncbi:MAG TPA: helix-turn-helix transcriptional regulator, partial [Vicinamibacteria bacterium]|jgi:DNA-binding PadR family transcriptional regulator
MDSRLPLTPLSYQILIALADGPKHGYGIIKDIEEASGDPLKSSTGTLYLAIQRLEQEGLLEEDETLAGEDSRRRYYRLSAQGREVAVAETRRLATLLGVARNKKLVGAQKLDGLLKASTRKP